MEPKPVILRGEGERLAGVRGSPQSLNRFYLQDGLSRKEGIMDTRQSPIMKIITEGAHARGIRRPKDACPYPAKSRERRAWMEGYDATPWKDGPDCPIAIA
jgi:ribosome modulation factor